MAVTTDLPRLIVNADDFGLTADINRGIMEAFAAGALRSTSVMVGMPGFDDAVRCAADAGNALGVGLHFTLTAGRPLTAARSLVEPDTGEFLAPGKLLVRCLTGRVDQRDVEQECAAQIARARAAGIRLTHIDGHHHVHLAPTVRDAVRRVVEAERIPAVRRPRERILGGAGSPRRLRVRLISRRFARVIDAAEWPVRTTDHFTGSALLGAKAFRRLLAQTLDTLPPGSTELMVHPGYVRGPLPGNDPLTTQREVELRALTSPDIIARFRSGRIRLIHFGDLVDPP